MKIYLVRHGDSQTAHIDDERPLSEKGKAEIEKITNFLMPLNLPISQIICSKKLRAQQTAKILSSSFPDTEIKTNNELDPLASVDLIMHELYAQNINTMLVGHMPFMGKLVSKLIAKNENKDIVAFPTGTIVCLEHLGSQQWIIHWLLNPELL